jgi:hypothetical protein
VKLASFINNLQKLLRSYYVKKEEEIGKLMTLHALLAISFLKEFGPFGLQISGYFCMEVSITMVHCKIYKASEGGLKTAFSLQFIARIYYDYFFAIFNGLHS